MAGTPGPQPIRALLARSLALGLDAEGLERGEPAPGEDLPLIGPGERVGDGDEGLVGLGLRLEVGQVAVVLDQNGHVVGDLGRLDPEGADVRIALRLVVQDGLK